MRQAAYLTLLTDSEVIAPSAQATTDETATDSPTDPPAPPTTVAATAPPSEATEAPATEATLEYQGPSDSESSGESAETDADISVDLSGKSDVEPTVLATTDLPRTTTTTAAPKPLATNPSLPVSI